MQVRQGKDGKALTPPASPVGKGKDGKGGKMDEALSPPLTPTGKGKDGKGAQYGKEQKASKGKTPELGKPETLLSKGPKGDLAGNTQFSPADKGKTDDPKKGKGGKDLKGGKAKEKKGP